MFDIFFQTKKSHIAVKSLMERVTGLEPATVCLEGRHSSQLSYTRMCNIILYSFYQPFSREFFTLGVVGFEPTTNRL